MTNLLSTFQKLKESVSPLAVRVENASMTRISSEDNPFNDRMTNKQGKPILIPHDDGNREENLPEFIKNDNLTKEISHKEYIDASTSSLKPVMEEEDDNNNNNDNNNNKLAVDDTKENHKAISHGTTGSTNKPIAADKKLDDIEEDEVPLPVLEEMNKLEECFPKLSSNYRLIDKIGEGTFSTVYKAEALNGTVKLGSDIWKSPPLKKLKSNKIDPKEVKRKKTKNPIVALKQIYVTSSPNRIYNELNLLYILTGNSHIAPLLDVLRYQDQVVAILPYYPHADFRDFYRDLPIKGIKKYLWELFQGLEFVHAKGIIHRDLKPTNFLYDPFKGKGVLVDFGLAEKVNSNNNKNSNSCPCDTTNANTINTNHNNNDPNTNNNNDTNTTTNSNTNTTGNNNASNSNVNNKRHIKRTIKAAYPKQDQRPPRRANRAGTRGFRAPEVLFKCTNQSTKLDIWSAGIIGLSLLSRKFPLFNSPDDTDAIIELAIIFGIEKLNKCAELHGCGLEINLDNLSNNLPNDGNILKLIYILLNHELENDSIPLDSVIFDTLKLYSDNNDRFTPPSVMSNDLKYIEDYNDHVNLFDLLMGCFQMDPSKRLTAKQILRLPFFKELSQDYDDDVIL